MRLTKLFKEFFESEKSAGIVLLACTVFSVLMSNSSVGESYLHFWHIQFFGLTLEHLINDGLMAIFFLLIGLELEREVYIGELSRPKEALLPIVAALGGMLVPAGLYLWVNWGADSQSGAGIPMATDIAFALGILSLLGKRVPTSLKVFLAALAVIDDLGAIVVIALFYTTSLNWIALLLALGVFGLLLLFNRLKVKALWIYLVGGLVMWYFMLNSGVHATITGVLMAFAIPFNKGLKESPSAKLQHLLHRPVAYFILPVFAIANTAIVFSSEISSELIHVSSLGVALGLIVGKPLGIFLFTFMAVKFGFCKLAKGLNWGSIFSVGLLGGIGFTMSIFITLLAFNDDKLINDTKMEILLSSFFAGFLGYLGLRIVYSHKNKKHEIK